MILRSNRHAKIMPTFENSTQFLRTRGLTALMVAAVAGFVLVLALGTRGFGPLAAVAAGGVVAVLVSLVVPPVIPFGMYFGVLFFAEARVPGAPLTVNQVLAMLFLCSFASYWLRGRTLRLESGLLPVLVAVAAYFTVSALTGESWERGTVHARYVVIYYLLAVCLAKIMVSERTVYAFCWIVVILTFLAAMVGLAEAISKGLLTEFSGNFAAGNRIRGTAKNSIVFAWNLVWAFPFAFLLFGQMRSAAVRIVAMTLGLSTLFVALLTFNRQTLVFVPLIMGAAALLYQYPSRRQLLALLAAAGVVLGATIMPHLVQRVLGSADIKRDISYLERRDQFLVAREMFARHPVFGVGLGSYPAVWGNYLPADYSTYGIQYQERVRERYPDMGYVQILSETGLVGLLFVVGFLVLIALRAVRQWHRARDAGDAFARNLSSAVIVLAVLAGLSAFIQDVFLYPRIWFMFGLALLLDERILAGKTAEFPATPDTLAPNAESPGGGE